MRRLFSFLSLCVVVFGICILSSSAWVGYAAPQFTSVDILTEKEIALRDYIGRIVVLEWFQPDCPFVMKQYSRTFFKNKGHIQSIQEKFTAPPYNVVWIALYSADPKEEGYLSPAQCRDWIKIHDAKPTALLMDSTKEIAKLFQVACIPEFFVINKEGVLAYRGSLDSIRSTDPTDIVKSANRHYLENALIQLHEGKPVFTQETIPYGYPFE